jgi:hypothetical protein
MAKKEKAVENEQVITLDGEEYKYSEITEEGKVAVQHLNSIERELAETRFLLDRHEGTKRYFIEALSKILKHDDEPDV